MEYENQHSFFTKNIVNFEAVLVRYVVKNEPLICEECLVDAQDVICHFNKFSKNNSCYNFTKFSNKNSYFAIFFSQLEKSDDGFAIVAEYFGRGMFRKQYDVDDTAAKALEGIKLKKNPIVENVQPKSDKRYSPKLTEKHPAVSINISKKVHFAIAG